MDGDVAITARRTRPLCHNGHRLGITVFEEENIAMCATKCPTALSIGLLSILLLGSLPSLAESVVYVDAGAIPGGDGASPSTAFPTIAEGVAAACAQRRPRTVAIAPGNYDEKEILTRCSLSIVGRTRLTFDANGRPTGVEENGVTAITGSLGDREALLRIVSSRTRVEGVLFRPQSTLGGITSASIEIGGYPDGTLDCPQGTIDGIEIVRVGLENGAVGVRSMNASVEVIESVSMGNTVGGAFFGASPGRAHTTLLRSTFNHNILSGATLLSTSVMPTIPGLVGARCGTTEIPRRAAHDVSVLDSEFSGNTQIGLRILSSWIIAHESADLDAHLQGNVLSSNGAYGLVTDTASRLGVTPLEGVHFNVSETHLDNVFSANGINDALVAFDFWSMNPAFQYVHDSTVVIWSSPVTRFDYRNPAEIDGVQLHNALLLNGEWISGETPPP